MFRGYKFYYNIILNESTIPTRRFLSSTTRTACILFFCKILSIVLIFVSGVTTFGFFVIISFTVSEKNLFCELSIARLTSPSVIMPTTSSFTTTTHQPNRPWLTLIIALPNSISGGTTGRSSLCITSRAVVRRRFPKLPPG